jgi:hypothetical protein
MASQPNLPEALQFLAKYQAVSAQSKFDSYQTADELATLAHNLSTKVAPAQRAVALALCDLFEGIRDNFNKPTQGIIDWQTLDAIVLEAVQYVAQSAAVVNSSASPRISSAVMDIRRQWCPD